MDRARVWPDFDDAWVLHEDRDLVVVDKPAGVPSQAADPTMPDDIVTRLRSRFPYLGVHQRLDKDTSGILVFARRREANAALATQFEGRSVEKRYLAAVTGWKAGRGRATLRDQLVQGDAGRMEVAPRAGRGAVEAVTHVRLLGQRGERAILELILETGRTHQARVQLAHAGAPIAGDALYGGAPAPRLLLHAHAITLAHPGGGGSARFASPAPPELDTWLENGDLGAGVYDDQPALARAIALALRRRHALGRSAGGPRATTAFRAINESGDALPELAVDVYGDHFVAQLYGDDGAFKDPARRERLLDALFAAGADGVYLKIRPKQANVIVDPRREDLAPRLPVRGAPAPDEVVILEEGVPYAVRLGDGLSTGIFLDQRSNRRRLRELSAGKRVLNLFAYTCAFSVVAARGGATRTVSVDASAAALERGRENLVRNGAGDIAQHELVAEDVFRWLARAAKAGGPRFDVVVLDPPSYSTTKHRRFVSKDDYAELAAAAIAVTAPGGMLLACSNHRGIVRVRFRRSLFEAARLARRNAAKVRDLPDPLDFPPSLGAEPHLKSAIVTLSD